MEELEESLKLVGVGEEDTMAETNLDAVVRGWVTWCRSHAFVRCNEADVPSGILPKGYRGVLIDVKVGMKKRQPDDKIYLAHKELRAKVARGNCVLELSKMEKGRIASTKYIFLVFALRKFSGGMGDEDDSTYNQSQWEPYFIKPISNSKTLISTEKANGEAAHITSLKLFGQTYFSFGSKNVHMLVREKDDVQKYTESRFEFARRVAHSFYVTYLENPKIPESKKQSLISFLQENKYTGVAEMIQRENQHIVNLSYLKDPELKFICWTKPDLEGNFSGEDSYCALPVNECIDKAREFGLQTIDYENVNLTRTANLSDIVDEYMEKIRNDHGHEGKVLYFLDRENNTIGLIKKKTAWYILLRALRQKTHLFSSSNKSYTATEQKTAVTKRIKQIQLWLQFSDNYAASWTKISTSFVRWAAEQKRKMNANSEFPVMFENFLKENDECRAELDRILESGDMKTY